MTIRTRLSLWYSVLLLTAFSLLAGWAYYEMRFAHPVVTKLLAEEGHTPAEEVGEVLLIAGLPALLLSLVGGWFLMRRALSPVTELSDALEKIHAENLHQPLPRTGNRDELDRLTEVFNSMTRRLDESFQRVREFTLHASHELKTPLTVMRQELDAALHEDSLSIADRDRYASLIEEIDRLTQIVEGLNFLARADGGLLKLDASPVRLDELLRDAADDAQALAQHQQIEVSLQRCDPISVLGDRRRLRQLLLILTDNAVKYNQPRGSISLALRCEYERAVLTVSNSGPGIPSQVIGRVFDRFFRGDDSHSPETEGCGLGLTIAQGIVRAHGGEIEVVSEPGRLTTITLRLPALTRQTGETETEYLAAAI